MHRFARTGAILRHHKSTYWAVLFACLAAPAAPRREKCGAAVRSHRARVGSAYAGGYHTSFASRIKHCHPERSEGSGCWWISHLLCKSDTHELPLGIGRKEVAVGGPHMSKGGSAGAAAQDVLVAHELSIVFSDRPRPRLEVRIGRIGALGPFPHVAIHLRQAPTTGGSIGWSRVVQTTLNEIPFHGNMLCCHLPLGFSWEACIRPARIGIGFVVADVTDRLSFVYLAQP